MRKIILTAIIVMGLSSWSGVVLAAQYDFIPIDKVLQTSVDGKALKACSLLLIKDGKVVYKKAFGGWTTDRVVPIASGSKWLSGGVIMALVDEGKISLDDPVSKYIPEITGEKGKMTIGQMFSHTSGMPLSDISISRPDLTLEESVRLFAKLDPIALRGTAFAYGGGSMQIAGRVAEVASGKTWYQLFDEKLAKPLGMTQTNYNGVISGEVSRNPQIASGVQSTLDDFAKYLTMILNDGVYEGKQVLSKQALEAMFTDRAKGLKVIDPVFADRYPPWGKLGYGIGCWLKKDESTGQVVEVYSPGAFGFLPWIDYEHKVIGVFLTETSNAVAMPVYLEIMDRAKYVLFGTPLPRYDYSYHVAYAGREAKFASGQEPCRDRKTGQGYVALSFFHESMGAKVVLDEGNAVWNWFTALWSSGKQTVSIYFKGTNVKMAVGSNKMIVNGEKTTIEAMPVVLAGGSVMLPLMPVCQALGMKIEWDNVNRLASVLPAGAGEAAGSPVFEKYLSSCKATDKAKGINAVIQYIIIDSDNARYVVTLKDGAYSWAKGTAENPDATVRTPAALWGHIHTREVDPTMMYLQRKFKFQGDKSLLLNMPKYLEYKGQKTE